MVQGNSGLDMVKAGDEINMSLYQLLMKMLWSVHGELHYLASNTSQMPEDSAAICKVVDRAPVRMNDGVAFAEGLKKKVAAAQEHEIQIHAHPFEIETSVNGEYSAKGAFQPSAGVKL